MGKVKNKRRREKQKLRSELRKIGEWEREREKRREEEKGFDPKGSGIYRKFGRYDHPKGGQVIDLTAAGEEARSNWPGL